MTRHLPGHAPASDHLAYDSAWRHSERRKGPTPLWLTDLLEDAGLGLVLAAGAAGVDRRGPVRWAHISEVPDPTPWLDGGEVLLTTGLAVKDDPALQPELIARLDERGCCGVGYGLGVATAAVPDAMLEEAEARALPLFTVPYEVPFIAVTKRVSRHIFDEHYATLRGAIDLHRQVLRAVLSGRGADALLEAVLQRVPEFAAVLYDYYGQVLAHLQASGRDTAVDEAALWRQLHSEHADRDRFTFAWGTRQVVAAVIRLGDQAEAVLALVGPRALLEHERLLLEQGLTGVSLELARGLSAREARRTRVDELLDGVADGILSERIADWQLERLGLAVSDGYEVLCLLHPPRVAARSLCALIEDAAGGSSTVTVVGRHAGAVYCLVSASDTRAAQRVADAVGARGWSGVTIGRSRTKKDCAALAAAIQEARMAAAAPADAAGRIVRDVGSLGLPGLIAGIHDSLGADAFVASVLGPLLDYDATEGTQLVGSLRAFLRHGCRPGPAADELFVHRHTLSYRLERIRALTGRDPRNGEHLVEFGVALALHTGHGTSAASDA